MRRVLYLHGFASGPMSRKGQAFDAYLSARGYTVERLDLRLPNRDALRVSAMMDHVRERLRAGPALLIGSSLGGLVAAHVAEGRHDVLACILMAPAFRFAERWRASLGEDRLQAWRAGTAIEVPDHAGGEPLQVDYGFYEDAAAIDTRFPTLAMPVLLMHGVHDDVVPIAGSRAFEGHLRSHGGSATFVELEDGHALTESIPMMLPLALRFLDA